MAAVRVYFVRHGETEENKNGIMQGQLDTELNKEGIEQAELTANALENVDFAAAHSSDLKRAVKTAEIILAKHRGVRLQTHEALRERYMGDWQGQPIAYRARVLPENLEPTADFVQRADQWWTQNIVRTVASSVAAQRGSAAAAEEETPGAARNVLVVSHGGLMHVLLQHLIESRRVRVAQGVDVGRYRFPNTSVTVIDVDAKGRGTVVMFGDTTHLDVEFVGAETNADDVEH